MTQLLADDGCYDLLHDGALIARLMWVSKTSERNPHPGWWLAIDGEQDELIYKVPDHLLGDLPRARQRSVSMSLGLAQHMLTSRAEGLLEPNSAT